MDNSISVRCTLNREHLPANKKATIYLALEISPPDAIAGALPSAICLLLDRSGSMEGEKLEQAKSAASHVLEQLKPMDHLGMVTFCSEVARVASVEPVPSIDISALDKRIRELHAEGTTELYRGLDTAYQQLLRMKKTAGEAVKRVILLSDGQPTDNVPTTEYVKLARRMREIGISVLALGIGPDYNEDLLGAIAEHSGGVWRHISSPSEIAGLFSRQVQETKTVIHTNPEVLMHLSKDVEVKEVFRVTPEVYPVTDLKQSGAEVRIPLSDIKAGEPQTVAIKLGVPPRPEGQFRLAKVQITGGAPADIMATYTNDERLWEIENNAFPRGIFLTAETQVLTRKGLSGDETALREAERKRDTILRDSSLTKIRTIHDTVVKAGETLVKAKAGMSEEETKVAKQEMTQIKRRSEE